MLKGKTYNQLVVFNAIVKEGSIVRAAQRLEIASPSVSQSLKALEDELGFLLFVRTTRTLKLTDAGELLYQNTTHLMNGLNHALETVREQNDEPAGSVSITIPRFVYQYLIEPIYADFCRRFPAIKLEINVSDEAIDIIEQGFDMGIRFGKKVSPGMVARQLTPPMKEALFVSAEYRSRHGMPQNIDELSHHSLIQYRFVKSKQLAPLSFDDQGQNITVDMPISLIVNDTDVMIDAAKKGLGIGRIVEPMVVDELANGTLLAVLPQLWVQYSGLYLYFPKDAQRARRVRVLVDYLVEYAQKRFTRST